MNGSIHFPLRKLLRTSACTEDLQRCNGRNKCVVSVVFFFKFFTCLTNAPSYTFCYIINLLYAIQSTIHLFFLLSTIFSPLIQTCMSIFFLPYHLCVSLQGATWWEIQPWGNASVSLPTPSLLPAGQWGVLEKPWMDPQHRRGLETLASGTTQTN